MIRPASPQAPIHDPHGLISLTDTGLGHLFQSWRGRSGRRLICSVYALETPPVFDPLQAVMFAVRREGTGARILFACAGLGERAFARRVMEARALGAQEWHVHLLATTPEARAAAIADFFPRPA